MLKNKMFPSRRSFEGLVFSGLLAVAAATPGLANAQFNTSAMTGFPTSGSPASMAGALLHHSMLDSSSSPKSQNVIVSDTGIRENVKSIEMSYAPWSEGVGRVFTTVVEPEDPSKPVKIKLGLNSNKVKTLFNDHYTLKGVSASLKSSDKSIDFEGLIPDGLVVEIYPDKNDYENSTDLIVYTFDKPSFEKEKEWRMKLGTIIMEVVLGGIASMGVFGISAIRKQRLR